MKKNAIGYARISTEDQSHFSIANQKDQIRLFCDKNNYNLLEIFTDEGQSAKNFDRKEWRLLEGFLKEHKSEIDFLIVMKYDRFSRNIVEALTTIDELERKYSVRLLSISEQIALPYDSPFFFQLRASMLLNAHHERLVISDRTKTGMRKALQSGHYISTAPFGYRNARDNQNKPILEINPEAAETVRQIFDWYLEGYSFSDIRKMASKIGFNHRGNSAVQKILTNKVYCGLIKSSIGNEPVEYSRGLHQPIIDEDTFLRVQYLLNKPKTRQHENELMYLKQTIVCDDCGRPMTCSRSKGRTKLYWYYECATHRKSFGMEKAHLTFEQILEELTFTDHQIEILQKNVRLQVSEHIQKNYGKLPQLESERTRKLTMLENLEEKFLSGKFDDESFVVWKTKLKKELKELNENIDSIQYSESKYWSAVVNEFERLNSLRDVFDRADVQQKRNFVEIGFGKQLTWDGIIYRTAYLNPIFYAKVLILRRKELLELMQKKAGNSNFLLGSPHRISTEPFQLLINWIKSVPA